MIKFLKNFFGLSKKELNGFLILCSLIVLIAFAPAIYSRYKPEPSYDYSAHLQEIERFRASAAVENRRGAREYFRNSKAGITPTANLFNFDPNGLDASLWRKLGLSDRQINVIKNYEAKGGRFYRKEDLKKIYSIGEEQYRALEPYITLPQQTNVKVFSPSAQAKPLNSRKIVEINSADSAQFETLYGIGPAFASRIIKYRKRLGGFHSAEQLREVYGIDSIVFSKIKSQIAVDAAALQPIFINKVTFDELKKNPYLTYKQMNAILQYRKQHGPYKGVADLKPIPILTEQTLSRLAPYLKFD